MKGVSNVAEFIDPSLFRRARSGSPHSTVRTPIRRTGGRMGEDVFAHTPGARSRMRSAGKAGYERVRKQR